MRSLSRLLTSCMSQHRPLLQRFCSNSRSTIACNPVFDLHHDLHHNAHCHTSHIVKYHPNSLWSSLHRPNSLPAAARGLHIACNSSASTSYGNGWYADQNKVFPPNRLVSSWRSWGGDGAQPPTEEQEHSTNGNGNGQHNEQQDSAQQSAATKRLAAEQAGHGRELYTVNVAIIANILIFMAKLGVYSISGSSALLAEAIHSVADIGNQALLRTGILQSKKAPTPEYPYGFSRDKFIWSLISAVGIFCLGSGVTIAHGVSALWATHELTNMGLTVTVLALSLVLEGWSLQVAYKTVKEGAAARGMKVTDYIKRGMDPTSTAVMLEDGGAVAGLLIAGVCSTLVYYTGNVLYDAVGSICVGSLLGVIAVFLMQRNRQLLLGRSMSTTDMAIIMEHMRKDPVVRAVYDAKSEEIGIGVYRFKAEIDFSGESVVQRHLERLDCQLLYQQMQAASWTADTKALERVLQEYGKEIISAVGAEVDRIESEIMALVPGVKYVDLETDRGQTGTRGLTFKRKVPDAQTT